jgi:hypothetical protein
MYMYDCLHVCVYVPMSQGKMTEKKKAQYLLQRLLSIRLYRTMILCVCPPNR